MPVGREWPRRHVPPQLVPSSPMSVMHPADRMPDASCGEKPRATRCALSERNERAPTSNESQVTSAQIRAARALLNLSGRKLSERSGISPSTLHRAENADGKPNMHASTLVAIKAALETLGVEFLDETGVRLIRTVTSEDSFISCDPNVTPKLSYRKYR